MTEQERKERMREYQRKYRESHKQLLAEKKRKWREDNKEHVAEYNAEYRRTHKEQKREANHRYYVAHRKSLNRKHKAWAKKQPDYIDKVVEAVAINIERREECAQYERFDMEDANDIAERYYRKYS